MGIVCIWLSTNIIKLNEYINEYIIGLVGDVYNFIVVVVNDLVCDLNGYDGWLLVVCFVINIDIGFGAEPLEVIWCLIQQCILIYQLEEIDETLDGAMRSK